MKNAIVSWLAALLVASGTALASGGADIRMPPAPSNPLDAASLQRGARDFVNYCVNCHSAKYMRYNRLTDLGISEPQIAEHLIFTGKFVTPQGGPTTFAPTKTGDTMQTALLPQDGKAWFGTAPPDLSLEARVRGTEWLYNYFRAFYRDDDSPTGWNNLLFPNVAMPHVLWELQGTNRVVNTQFDTHEEAEAALYAARGLAALEPVRGGKWMVRTLVADTPGRLTPQQYDQFVADLVNYMDYMAEPNKLGRGRVGIVVLLFLGLLFVFAYLLKRNYWSELH